MKRTILTAIVSSLITLAVAGAAVAQSSSLAKLLSPLVVSIEQAVPVELTIAREMDDGSVVTSTVPLTVGVNLEITIDGDHVVALAAQEPAAPVVVNVAPLSPSENETPTPPSVTDATPQIAVECCWGIPAKEGPSYDYKTVGDPKWDVPYPVIGRTSDNLWLQIIIERRPAWIKVDSYLKQVNPDAFGPGGSAIPILTPPPTYTPTPEWLTAP